MLGSETPFSFAMTGFPQNLLPLLFPPLSVDVSADAFDSIEDLSEIRLPRDRCEYHYASLAPDFRQFPGLTLGSCSKRKYPDIYNAKHHYSIERQKKLKAEKSKKDEFVSKFASVAKTLGVSETETHEQNKVSDYVYGDGIGE